MAERTAPVSVIIPAYNAERFIRAAIESVQAQTLPVAEIIVVDDGSSDDTYKIASDLGARVIRQSNQGVSAARNVGIQAATQPWIGLNDADDLWEPQKLELQWAAIEKYPDSGIVYSGLIPFLDPSCSAKVRDTYASVTANTETDPSSETTDYYAEVPEDFLAHKVARCPSTVLVRRDALIASGMFDETLRFYEDYECFLRVLRRHSFVIVEKPLVKHRIHNRNVSHDRTESNLTFVKLIERLNQYPEKYPHGAAQALDNSTYWPFFLTIARSLLEEGRTRSARFVLSRYFRRTYSNRAVFLWCLTLLGPHAFKSLLAIKRSMQKTSMQTKPSEAA